MILDRRYYFLAISFTNRALLTVSSSPHFGVTMKFLLTALGRENCATIYILKFFYKFLHSASHTTRSRHILRQLNKSQHNSI